MWTALRYCAIAGVLVWSMYSSTGVAESAPNTGQADPHPDAYWRFADALSSPPPSTGTRKFWRSIAWNRRAYENGSRNAATDCAPDAWNFRMMSE